jgi:shikimate kinase
MARCSALPRLRIGAQTFGWGGRSNHLTRQSIVTQSQRPTLLTGTARELPRSMDAQMIRFGWRKNKPGSDTAESQAVRARIGGRSIVLVGLMGCGKSSIGRRLAARLELPFIDADDEIERAAGRSIPDIFAEHGEAYFREGERKVIQRLLACGPQVLATGGGAFMNADTRDNIRQSAISIWLKAELPVLMRRVAKRDNRPLLKEKDPEAVMRNLMATRYPIYAEADLTVDSREVAHDVIVGEIVGMLARSPVLGRPAGGGETAADPMAKG